MQASGGGDYWGEYGKQIYRKTTKNKTIFLFVTEGVKAKVYIKANPHMIDGRKYLSLQQIKMDFSVKDIRMGVENVHGGNSVLRKYFFFAIT